MSDREWQPIDTAPLDGETIRVWSEEGEDWAWFSVHGWLDMAGKYLPAQPTHWSPAPSRQKEDS